MKNYLFKISAIMLNLLLNINSGKKMKNMVQVFHRLLREKRAVFII